MANAYCAKKKKPRTDNCDPKEELNQIVGAIIAESGLTLPETAVSTYLIGKAKSCEATFIRNVSGSKGPGTVTRGKPFGGGIGKVTGKAHKVVFFDPQHLENIEYWNSLELDSEGYDFFYVTKNFIWPVMGHELSFLYNSNTTEENTTFIEGSIEVDWTQIGDPIPIYEANVGRKLNKFIELDVAHISGSLVGATVANDVITVAPATPFTVPFQLTDTGVATPLTWTLIDGEAPAGVTLLEASGVLGGTLAAGTYEITVQAQTPCALKGRKTYKLVSQSA